MQENNQPADAPEFRTIRKSAYLTAEGGSLQIAYLELSVPSTLSDRNIHMLELETASLMRSVASCIESHLFPGHGC